MVSASPIPLMELTAGVYAFKALALATDLDLFTGLSDQVALVEGDFFTDPLPRDHDVLLLSNILHDWSSADVSRLVGRCADALPSGGRLLICESFVADDKTGPPLAALMSLNMLVETWGQNYTAAEYSAWLSQAGLQPEGVTEFDGLGANGVLVARKP